MSVAMATEHTRPPIFSAWTDAQRAVWGHQPLKIGHTLHTSPLFTRDGLAELIERYPREHYALVYMGAQGGKRFWREGRIDGMKGQQVIEAIAQGRMWLNLRRTNEVDRRYDDVLDQLFAEVSANVPGGYPTFSRTCGILISSPKAQVYFHCDLPGQSLWQIAGAKTVYIYPNTPPFLTPEALEKIAVFEVEVDMEYQPWYDVHAIRHELQPGQMLHWPLNAPHRVENHDCLNISMTTEYWTETIRRRQMLNMGNGLLRHKLGLAPKGRAITGPAFWSKALLQAAAKRSGWLAKARRDKRPIDFTLDPARPGQIVDLVPVSAAAVTAEAA